MIDFKPIMIFCLCGLMASCSYISKPFSKNGHSDYMSAKSIPPLSIPAGVPAENFQDTYPVSTRTYPKDEVNVSIIPPGLNNQ